MMYGSQISFIVDGKPIDTPSITTFKLNDGRVVALTLSPLYFLGNPDTHWIVIQRFPE